MSQLYYLTSTDDFATSATKETFDAEMIVRINKSMIYDALFCDAIK